MPANQKKLTLDHATLSGDIAIFEQALVGTCQKFYSISPDREIMLVEKITLDACGSKIISGKLEQKAQAFNVEITDNRLRVCDDVPGTTIVATFTIQSDKEEKEATTFYSY